MLWTWDVVVVIALRPREVVSIDDTDPDDVDTDPDDTDCDEDTTDGDSI
jgi:hypothetical protein